MKISLLLLSALGCVLSEYTARLQRGSSDRSVLYEFSVTLYCIHPAFD